jgi:hypothetical protein
MQRIPKITSLKMGSPARQAICSKSRQKLTKVAMARPTNIRSIMLGLCIGDLAPAGYLSKTITVMKRRKRARITCEGRIDETTV